jgi:hypothetical protein
MSDEKNIHKCRSTDCSVMVDGLVYCRDCLSKIGDRFAESQRMVRLLILRCSMVRLRRSLRGNSMNTMVKLEESSALT